MTDQGIEDPQSRQQENFTSEVSSSQTISQPSTNLDSESTLPKSAHADPIGGSTETSNLLMVMFTGVIALGTIFQGLNSYYQWETMKQQLALAKEQVDLSQRPWVAVEYEPRITFARVNGTWYADLHGVLTNHGTSVALDVVHGVSIYADGEYSDIKSLVNKCDRSRTPPLDMNLSGEILFPKTELKIKKSLSASDKRFSGGVYSWLMVGCVMYRSSYDPLEQPRHQTIHVYSLERESGSSYQNFEDNLDPVTYSVRRLPVRLSAD